MKSVTPMLPDLIRDEGEREGVERIGERLIERYL